MSDQLHKIIDYHRQASGGMIELSQARASELLRDSGAPNADAYVGALRAASAAAKAAVAKGSRPESGSKFLDNASFGGTWPRLMGNS